MAGPRELLETIGQPVEVKIPFSLSPDGSQVAYAAGPGSGQSDIWVLELTAAGAHVYVQQRRRAKMVVRREATLLHNSSGIHRKAADGSGEEELLMKGAETIRAKRVARRQGSAVWK